MPPPLNRAVPDHRPNGKASHNQPNNHGVPGRHVLISINKDPRRCEQAYAEEDVEGLLPGLWYVHRNSGEHDNRQTQKPGDASHIRASGDGELGNRW